MTWQGELLHIFIAEAASMEMEELAEGRMIPGVGIEGDRYATAQGTYSHMPHEDRQCTLMEIETMEALERDHGLPLTPQESRRNLTTRGVPLNHLVGRHFRVGEVLLFGGRLNKPCKYFDDLLGRPLFNPLLNRSGLNCRIIEGGVIRPGDTIRPA
ncbi:MOSC domain-containing protein [Rhodovarius lipocyclicus]|uniref:MOSC domain-containing protein n=1 Tax=Rhodovarius lipocyclicus TaxID=268410 RepID=UPI0013585228|nr:MOSC domain-containing protein [Rhodovarius lipocyclicus]